MNINTIVQSLQGRKTYLTTLLVGALLFGSWQGWWKLPPEIYAGLAALAAAFLRAGVSRELANTPFAAGIPPLTAGPASAQSPVETAKAPLGAIGSGAGVPQCKTPATSCTRGATATVCQAPAASSAPSAAGQAPAPRPGTGRSEPADPSAAGHGFCALVLIAALALAPCACQTQNAAGRSLASIAATVDHAMQAWATRVADGQASPEQETKVAAAYADYQLAMKAAESAYAAAQSSGDATLLNQVLASLEASQSNLVALIQSLSPPLAAAIPQATNPAPASISK